MIERIIIDVQRCTLLTEQLFARKHCSVEPCDAPNIGRYWTGANGERLSKTDHRHPRRTSRRIESDGHFQGCEGSSLHRNQVCLRDDRSQEGLRAPGRRDEVMLHQEELCPTLWEEIRQGSGKGAGADSYCTCASGPGAIDFCARTKYDKQLHPVQFLIFRWDFNCRRGRNRSIE